MFLMHGITEGDWEGDLPPDEGAPVDGVAAAPIDPAIDPDVSDRIKELRDPATQFRFLHEEARDGGKPEAVSIEMRSEVLIVEWRDANGHVFRQDDAPKRCSVCRAMTFDESMRIEERTVVLPLKFSQVEIHRKKIYALLEHLAMMVRTSMLEHYPHVILTPQWMAEHRGVVEVGLTASATQSVLRDIFLKLGLSDPETIDGITDAALTVAGIALLGLRQRRVEEMEKKAESPTTNGHAPGSPASITSSSPTDTATTTS